MPVTPSSPAAPREGTTPTSLSPSALAKPCTARSVDHQGSEGRDTQLRPAGQPAQGSRVYADRAGGRAGGLSAHGGLCESPAATPPANLLPQIAAALGVLIDDLFGVGAKPRLVKQDGDSRLRRRLLAIEKLDVAEKRQVLQVIDALIERGQLKRKAESRA